MDACYTTTIACTHYMLQKVAKDPKRSHLKEVVLDFKKVS